MSYHCCEKFHIAIPAGHILKLRKFEHYVKKTLPNPNYQPKNI